ncbi:F-box/kelch-repeat protein at3g06240 [Phtheirospermum japonicum]|uniref:F-box/kelch-repeat protein at3g06240 n=1 Tax=Phtheirospermum japonicum TaxID=374723 RepID=A0A830C0F9_9LAMI|nr:F-box/kelch-repeat protein at3g06240 [Phtheirospermum japonicum]
MDLYTSSIQSIIEGSNSATQIYPTTNDNSLLLDRARVDYPFSGRDGEISLVGSCNGLVCVSLHTHSLVLWNPTTGKWKRIPDSDTDVDTEGGYCISFAFGYDELHDDYKVVESMHVMRDGWFKTGGMVVTAYSLRTNSWKTLSNWPGGGHKFGGSGQFLNGAIHWSVREFGDDDYWAIVSHDLATDTFNVLRLPDFDDGGCFVVVDVLQGRLALNLEYKFHMDVWVMK